MKKLILYYGNINPSTMGWVGLWRTVFRLSNYSILVTWYLTETTFLLHEGIQVHFYLKHGFLLFLKIHYYTKSPFSIPYFSWIWWVNVCLKILIVTHSLFCSPQKTVSFNKHIHYTDICSSWFFCMKRSEICSTKETKSTHSKSGCRYISISKVQVS